MLGSSPGMGLRPLLGRDSRSIFEYGCKGSVKKRVFVETSAIWPQYITAILSASSSINFMS